MKKVFNLKLLISFTLLLLGVIQNAHAIKRYAVANGNWDATTTWSATSGGAAGASVPVAGDTVYIGDGAVGYTVTIPTGYTASVGEIFIGLSTATTTSSIVLADATAGLTVSGNITINKPGGNAINSIAVNAGAVQVSGNFTLAGTTTQASRIARITITTGTLTIGGNLVFVTGSANNNVIDMSGGAGLLRILGSWTGTVGTLTPGTTSTVSFEGSTAQNIPVLGSYNNLTLNSSNAANFTLSAALTTTNLRGNILVDGSSIFITGNRNIAFNAGKGITVAENASVDAGTSVVTFGTTGTALINGRWKTANTNGFSGTTTASLNSTNNPTITLGSKSTVEFSGTAAQTITGRNYVNLATSGAGSKTISANTNVAGNLNTAGGNIADGGRTLTVNGNMVNNVTFTGAGKVVLSGGSAAHDLSGTGVINNLDLNDAANATLSSNVTVSGTLTLIAGKITTGTNVMIVGTSTSAGTIVITTPGVTKCINGNLRKYIPAGSGVSQLLPVSDANDNYVPATLSFAGTITNAASNLGYLQISSSTAQPAVESGINQTNYINRKWSISNSGITGFSSFSARLQYVGTDVQGSLNAATAVVRVLSNSTWLGSTAGTNDASSAQGTAITGFGDFYVGESTGGPSVTGDPSATSICKGNNASFTASATGSPAPTVKWQRSKDGTNWTDITANLDAGTTYSNFTTTTLNLTGSDVSLTGNQYRAIFINVNGSTPSLAATLTVQDKPVSVSISSDDADNTICVGNAVKFTATPTNGGDAPAYQWRINGVDVSGETGATFTTSALSNNDVVTVVLTSNITPCASGNPATSNGITMKVNSKPTVSITSSTNGICEGGNAVFTLTGTSGATVTYNVNGGTSRTIVLTGGTATITVTAITQNTTLNLTAIAIVSCTESLSVSATIPVLRASTSTTTEVQCNSFTWNGTTYTTSGTYTAKLLNAVGCDSTATLNLTINRTSITTQPVGSAICPGTSTTLSVVGAGPGTLTYVWKKDGTAIPAANNASYSANAAGSYTVDVTGDCGTVTSAAAVVSFKTATAINTQPLGGALCAGDTLTVLAVGQGTLTYQWKKDGVNITGATSNKLAVTAAGTYTVTVTAECGTATSNNAVVTIKTATAITSQPVGSAICNGASTLLSVTAAGQGTLTYQWQKDSVAISGANAATYTATLAGNYRVIVTGECGSVTSSVAAVTFKTSTSITTQPVSSAICTVGGSTTLSVVAAGNLLTYQWRKDGVNIPGATTASYVATAIGTYQVTVAGECGTVTSDTAVVTIKATTAITTQPLSGGLCPNSTYTLSVVATGDGILTYQWRRNGTNIIGATAATYAANQTGTYSVVVTGTCGSVTSNNADVTALSTTTNSLFPNDPLPKDVQNNKVAIEAGVKFRSSVNGFITAIRLYKPFYLGNYTVNLWDATTQMKLASSTLTSPAVGWSTVPLNTAVPITAGTLYVASYYSATGDYAVSSPVFDTAVRSGFLEAPASATVGGNGVYKYGTSGFPTSTLLRASYMVDVVFATCLTANTTPPAVISKTPVAKSNNNATNSTITALFSEALDPTYINATSVILTNSLNQTVSSSISYEPNTRKITLVPNAALIAGGTYKVTLKGGTSTAAIRDLTGTRLAKDYIWSFTVQSQVPFDINLGRGGPVLVLNSGSNPFSRYTAEILRAEGLNGFSTRDINIVTADTLNRYDAVVLGEITLTAAQVTLLTNWVNAGGTLVAFRPDAKLNTLMGITSGTAVLPEGYLLVDTTNNYGRGIVGETIQYHGTATLYNLTGASALATLYADANTATQYPAVTLNNVGTKGGKAIAFAFDLPRSIVYTRQGNPAWAGVKRDGVGLTIRSDDMFFGNSVEDPQPDWVDFNKIAIPQADEQQHFLANIISQGMLHRKPLPRFWFLPRKLKAAVIMTGDDHANGGTAGRFNEYLGYGNNTADDVKNWRAIRSTSYIYPTTALSDTAAASYVAKGFEIGIHLNTFCTNYDVASLDAGFNMTLSSFSDRFPSLNAPVTHRTHCVVWTDWASKVKAEVLKGMRLNTDYYYWPDTWVKNRPGLFTGSGMPMRFADLDGTMIDNYQVTTQMPDESGLVFPDFINTLLDNALGNKGYYGAFCANMHTDVHSPSNLVTQWSTQIVNAAIARNVPVISSKQMLTWLDGRNNSTFSGFNWSAGNLTFTVTAAAGADNLQGMVPVKLNGGELTGITYNGAPLAYTQEVIKGVNYAFFNALTGSYTATYFIDNVAPVISEITATPNVDGSATITWKTDEMADEKVIYGTAADLLSQTGTNSVSTLRTAHSITIPGLAAGNTYYYRVISSDANANVSTVPSLTESPLILTMPGAACFFDNTAVNFAAGTTENGTLVSSIQGGEVKLKPAAAAEFNTLPPATEWKGFSWAAGDISVASGLLTVNGQRYNSQPESVKFGAGTALEFSAIFNASTFQNIGLGGGSDAIGTGGIFNGENAWAVFTTGNSTTTLRTSVYLPGAGAVLYDIPGSYLGVPNRYRIEWKPTSIEFYINDLLVNTENITITERMRPAISDFSSTAPGISVDWIYTYPYAASGTYLSRVFDAGIVKSWKNVLWGAQVPTGTSLQIDYRSGNTDTPDSTWSAFTNVPVSNTILDVTARYMQYRVLLTSSNGRVTPVLSALGISCGDAPNFAPDVTRNPQQQIRCVGDSAVFTTTAIGLPAPKVSWQVSADKGQSWSTILGATKDTLKVLAALPEHGKLFRCIWTNTLGSDTSAPAIFILGTPTGNLTVGQLCNSSNIGLTFNSTTGTGPYRLLINDSLYSNVTSGIPFTTEAPAAVPAESIWRSTVIGGEPAIPDNAAVEVGVKFRSNVPGMVTGIRYYKRASNTGVHKGSLWTSTGTLLATATFTGETASGWQQVTFSSPVTIVPGVTYVASYYAPVGNYSVTPGAFTNSGITNITGSLTALKASDAGGNGLYKYGGGFPDQVSGSNANYFVDVIFKNSLNISRFVWTSVTGGTGCATTGTPIATLDANLSPLALNASSTKLACLENTNGSFTVTGLQGNTPYTYSFDNGVTYLNSGSLSNLAAGSYPIKVKDAGNCIKDTVIIIDVDKAVWTGVVSTDWHTAGNWNIGKVPTSSTHVIVPVTTNACVVSLADASAASVQVANGATIRTINNRVLSLSGKCAVLPPVQ